MLMPYQAELPENMTEKNRYHTVGRNLCYNRPHSLAPQSGYPGDYESHGGYGSPGVCMLALAHQPVNE